MLANTTHRWRLADSLARSSHDRRKCGRLKFLTLPDGLFKHTYDAWNRLKDTSTKGTARLRRIPLRFNSQSVLVRTYDALGRIIKAQTYPEGAVVRTDQYYYNISAQQIIEVRED